MAEKRSKKSSNFLLILLSSTIIIFLASVIPFFAQKPHITPLNFLSPPVNEDLMSQYVVPKDVLQVVDQAKTTGLPVLGIRADGPSYKIPVLMYHYVEYVKDKKDTTRQLLDVNPALFESEIKTLINANYTFLTPSDLADILDGIAKLPDNPVLLTFDDGYEDFYTDAYPILKKYHIKAAQYVITGFIGKTGYLTADQVKTIANDGLVEIGAHTIHHVALKGLEKDFVSNEIGGSKVELEALIKKPVTTFAYPYGSFDLNAIQDVKIAGFRTALCTVPGTEVGNYDRFFVNRLRPGGATGNAFLKLISQ